MLGDYYMKNPVKIVLLLILFAGFAVCSFGDTFLSMSGGFYRLTEQYPTDGYGRDLDGGNFIISLNHYTDTSPLGWFFRTSFGEFYSGFEWLEEPGKPTQLESQRIYNSSDIQISGGPSVRLKLGSIIHVPISLGPAFTFYREENNDGGYNYWGWYDYENNGFYRAYNLGLLADASIIINPYRWLTITALGVCASWDFLHWESGNSVNRLRAINNGRYELKDYHGVKIGFHFGVGFRFDNPNGRKNPEPNRNTAILIDNTNPEH